MYFIVLFLGEIKYVRIIRQLWFDIIPVIKKSLIPIIHIRRNLSRKILLQFSDLISCIYIYKISYSWYLFYQQKWSQPEKNNVIIIIIRHWLYVLLTKLWIKMCILVLVGHFECKHLCRNFFFFPLRKTRAFTLWYISRKTYNDIYFEKFGSGAFSWGEAARAARIKCISVPYCFSPPLVPSLYYLSVYILLNLYRYLPRQY